MKSRNIINAIIKDKTCPERMGLFEHYWDDTIPEWENQGYPKNTLPQEYFDYDIWHIPTGCIKTDAIPDQNEIVEETDETVIKRNGWGALHRYWKHKSGTPEHIGFDMTGPEIWREKYRDRLLGFNPRRFNDIDQLKVNFRKCADSDKWTCFHGVLPVEIMRHSMGDIVMLESVYIAPDWIRDFCEVVTDMLITHYEYLLNEVGVPDGMFFYEDMGYTYGPIMSPDSYRELIAPSHRRFVDWVHSRGMPIVMHSCGKIRPFLKTIFENGVDCLQVLEAKAGQHVVEMANFVENKMAFMGNLNIVAIESNDPKIIDAEILPKLDAIRKNRIPYVFHSDHSIPKTVKLDTYRYVLSLFKKYGHY